MSKLTRLAVMMAAILAGPASAVADERSSDELEAGLSAQRASVALASEAAKEAAVRAAKSISANQAVKLDVRLDDLTSLVREDDPVTVASN